ncbi:MAG: heavy metal translocating P-type ATPase [Clostridium sp.]
MSKKQLVLENLHCANCASKIENKIKQLDNIKDVTVNFMTRSLIFEAENENFIEDTIVKIKEIVNKIEPDVIVKGDYKKKSKTIPLKTTNIKKATIVKKEEKKESCCSGHEHHHNHKHDSEGCCSEHNHSHNHKHSNGGCCDGHDHSKGCCDSENILKTVKHKEIKRNKKELILEGLDCANCASKIENKTKELDKVKEANLNFMNKTLVFQYDKEENIPIIIEEIKAIVKKLEPDVKVLEKEVNKSVKSSKKEKTSIYKDHRKEINKIIIGGAIFAVGSILNLSENVELIVFLVAYFIVGGEIVLRALKNISRGQIFDENFLMTIATVGAFIIGEYPEGVGVMLFYQVGELFQHIAVNNSRKSISSLMDIRPDFANLKRGNDIVVVSPEEVNIGEYIIVKPGEKVPLDGVVLDGVTTVDTSALTGESMPRNIEKGDEVLSGFINQTGVVTVEVTKDFGQSTVSKILDLVQNAGNRKAKAENFITKFAKYYTPVVVIGAALLAIVPPLIIEGATFSECISRALIFLVISCPCALVISIPLGFFGGIGAASKNGVLIKGSNYLEILKDIETVVFDKTGTLTKGVFNVTKVNNSDLYDENTLLEYAAYAESFSNHPIAKSVVRAYKQAIDQTRIDKYEEVAGHGVVSYVDGKKVIAGNHKIMKLNNIKFKEIETVGTVIYVAIDDDFAGSIVIEDTVKEDAREAIKKLKLNGVKNTVMLTGDNEKVALKVGKSLGLDKVYYELLPQNKVEKLEQVDANKSKGKKIAFVGDGINDAPVLARADVGIAMGGLGSDAAIEAADVVIMTDEPSKIATAINISKKTRKIVVQNIVFALGVKIIVLILGSLGMASMWEAVFADVGVAVLAILNAMRVMNYKKY